MRISRTHQAYGRIRKKILENRLMTKKTKLASFQSLVLSNLLYGVEVWNLHEKDFKDLRRCYRDCIRGICRNRLMGRKKIEDLLKKLDMPRLEDLINERQLQWIGKIVRMDKNRLPRKFLFSWIHKARNRGGRLVYGQTIKTLIERNLKVNRNIAIRNEWGAHERKNWMKIAENQTKWNEFIAYCPAIRDGHLPIAGSTNIWKNEKHKKSHEQKVQRALRRLRKKRRKPRIIVRN